MIGSIVIGGVTLIVWLAVQNEWSLFQIFTGAGTLITVLGAIGLAAAFAGGTRMSNPQLDALSPELAMVDSQHALKRRFAFPIISLTILLIGVIFLVIGLIGTL